MKAGSAAAAIIWDRRANKKAPRERGAWSGAAKGQNLKVVCTRAPKVLKVSSLVSVKPVR